MEARILVKHSASKCNKELLNFLHSNIKRIKQKYSLKVVVVYDDLIPKLGEKIKQLPVLITSDGAITGNTAIQQKLVSKLGITNAKTAVPARDMGTSDLQDYWNSEMHSGVDEPLDQSDVLMDAVKNRAIDETSKHRESRPKKKKRETITSSAREDNIQLDNVKGDKISDMVDNDPIMQKFWANQESTPGFE
jgi:hypothetical protein